MLDPINWDTTHILVLEGAFTSYMPDEKRGFPGTSTKDQEKYLRLVGEKTSEFRAEGATVSFTTHMTGDKFIRPLDDKDNPLAIKNSIELRQMRWIPVLPTRKELADQLAQFKKVSETCAPLKRDAAAMKMTYNALNPKTKSGQGLLGYLKETECETVVLMGGNADVCISITALSAALQGYNVIILTDLTFWDKNPSKAPEPDWCENTIKSVFRELSAGKDVGILLKVMLSEKEGVDISSPNITEAFKRITFATSTDMHAAPTFKRPGNFPASTHGAPKKRFGD